MPGDPRDLLNKHKQIKLYGILENTTGTHNKVYILVVATDKSSKSTFLIKLWGRHDSLLSRKVEKFSQKSFDEAYYGRTTGKDKYVNVDDDRICSIRSAAGQQRYGHYVTRILEEIDKLK
jgi:hypothetical protein